MKRFAFAAAIVFALGLVLWAAAGLSAPSPDPAKLMPDGALLYIQAKDFQGLLKDWDSSVEKRTWLKGDNYAAFSRSRLFDRLSQAQGEFSTAATLPTDENLLNSVAGQMSAIALYDIGNLEFVYVTRMDEGKAQATPLWSVRDKFEQRTEGNATFYVHQDLQSNRTAAFAVRDGWLILGTRADLVAGVLDRLQGAQAHSLPDEAWYADAVKQAKGPADDLRMVINLEKAVPSPYFRSYWVQRNITEMKQYRSALCDLHRANQEYREDRSLLRKAGTATAPAGDINGLLVMAPEDAVFSSAVSSPAPDGILDELRENIVDLKPERAQMAWTAPGAVVQQGAGSSSDFETRIDEAPVLVTQTDPYQPLRAMLGAAQPTGMLKVFETHEAEDGVFTRIDRAIALQSKAPWNATTIESSLSTAIRPGLTASQLGVEWNQRSVPGGSYFALNGAVPMFFAIHRNSLLLSTSESLLQALLSRADQAASSPAQGVTYAAVFRHSQREQRNLRNIVARLDSAGPVSRDRQSGEDNGEPATGQAPHFFSGNMESLSRTFANVSQESIEEKDQGDLVTQTVRYQWKRQ